MARYGNASGPNGRLQPLLGDVVAASKPLPAGPGLAAWISEVIVLVMVCLSPWAFGSVDAWAELALDVGIALLVPLVAVSTWKRGDTGGACLTFVSVAALALLALSQAVSLPSPVLRLLDPGAASLRAALVPRTLERVAGDSGTVVNLPRATISQNPEASIAAAARLGAACLLFGCVFRLGGNPRVFNRFATTVVINATLLAMFATIQWLSWDGRIAWIRPSPRPEIAWYSGGPFVCHNHLAAYLNVGLGLALGTFLAARWGDARFRQLGTQMWIAYAVAVVIVGLIASHSRGGMLASLAAGATMLALLRRGVVRPGLGLGLALAVVAITVLSLLFVAGDSSPWTRIASVSGASSDIRWTVWSDALRAWQAHPIWGTGFGSFATAVLPFSDRTRGFFFARAENEYVDVLVEGGLVGFAIALVGLAAAARLAARAPHAVTLSSERGLILGGWFAGLALMFHWLCDFNLHIPGVAITAVVLCAHLCRFGVEAARRELPASGAVRRGPGKVVAAAVSCVVAGLIVFQGYRQARAEAQLQGTGLPAPDSSMPTSDFGQTLEPTELERIESALVRALEWRPDWAEGHLRLGLLRLQRYQRAAATLVGQVETDPEQVAMLTSPLWLHGKAHPGSDAEAVPPEAFLEHEPVQNHLVPAARSFLEARRCSPVLALPHLELGLLDYLLIGGSTTRVYVGRALEEAGSDRRVLEMGALLAAQDGDGDLATRCWRQLLRVAPESWEMVADSAASLLPAEVLLSDVLPPRDGRLPVLLAERIYLADDLRPARELLLRAALERLPGDPDLTPSERLSFEARSLAGLGNHDEALSRMSAALALDPLRGEWRRSLVGWLVAWGRLDEAHRQVIIGLQLHPDDEVLVRARETVVEALARGNHPVTGSHPPAGKINDSE